MQQESMSILDFQSQRPTGLKIRVIWADALLLYSDGIIHIFQKDLARIF